MNDKETVRLLKNGNVKGLESLIDKYAAYAGTVIRRPSCRKATLRSLPRTFSQRYGAILKCLPRKI